MLSRTCLCCKHVLLIRYLILHDPENSELCFLPRCASMLQNVSYKYFFGPLALLRLYVTYAPASTTWKAIIMNMKSPIRGDLVCITVSDQRSLLPKQRRSIEAHFLSSVPEASASCYHASPLEHYAAFESRLDSYVESFQCPVSVGPSH